MSATPDTSSRPLRVAIVVSRFPVASETFVINIAAGLVARGHDVTIHAAWGRGRGPVHDLVRSSGLMDRLVAPPGRGARIVARSRALLRSLGRSTADLVGGSLPASVAIRSTPVVATLAQTFVGREDYDVIHAQFGPLGTQVLMLRDAGLVRGRLVTHFRGYDVSRYVRRHGPAAYTRLFAGGDLFLPNCAYFRDTLVEMGCDPERIVIHRSGIDLDLFTFRPPPTPEDRPVRLITVGRLTAKKGVDVVLDALASLAAAGRVFTFDVIGDGPRREELRRRAAELGLADRVTLRGGLDQSAVAAALREADVFVASSRTSPLGDRDGPVNTLKEAMATGLPAVGTRHGGIPELIEDGVSGVLVDEGDARALAAGLEALLDDPSRWPDLAAAARSRVETDYEIERLNDRLVEIYRRAIGPEPPEEGKEAAPGDR